MKRPQKSVSRKTLRDDLGGPGNHMQRTCPHCGSPHTKLMEEDETNMS